MARSSNFLVQNGEPVTTPELITRLGGLLSRAYCFLLNANF
jgi:hypothetical protein